MRSNNHIALAVASSGIASLLLDGGRTAHSRFKIPIDLNPTSTCSISKQSDAANLLKETKLIIWDEAPMMNKCAFEAVDRTLKDICDSEELFGGKVVVLSGDFRQVILNIQYNTEYSTIYYTEYSIDLQFFRKFTKVNTVYRN